MQQSKDKMAWTTDGSSSAPGTNGYHEQASNHPPLIPPSYDNADKREKEELQRQIQQLRLELVAKDDQVFELSATLATVQAETSHSVKMVQEESRQKLHQTQEALRRAQQEANLAHARLKQHQKQQQHQQHHPNASLISHSVSPNAAAALPPTPTPPPPRVVTKTRTIVVHHHVPIQATRRDYGTVERLASHILSTILPRDVTDSKLQDLYQFLSHVRQCSNTISELDFVWEIIQRTQSCLQNQTEQVIALKVFYQILLWSKPGRDDFMRARPSRKRSRIRFVKDGEISSSENGLGQLAQTLLGSDASMTGSATSNALYRVDTSRDVISRLVGFVKQALVGDKDSSLKLARESLLILSLLISSNDSSIRWWQDIYFPKKQGIFCDKNSYCGECIMCVLLEPFFHSCLNKKTKHRFHRALYEGSVSGAATIDLASAQFEEAMDLCTSAFHVMKKLVLSNQKEFLDLYGNGNYSRRLLALILDIMDYRVLGDYLSDANAADDYGLDALCVELLSLFSILYCQTSEGIALLRTQMIANATEESTTNSTNRNHDQVGSIRVKSGIALLVQVFYHSVLAEKTVIVLEAARALNMILMYVQRTNQKLYSFWSLVSSEYGGEMYKSACNAVLCKKNGMADAKDLIQLQLEEVYQDEEDENLELLRQVGQL